MGHSRRPALFRDWLSRPERAVGNVACAKARVRRIRPLAGGRYKCSETRQRIHALITYVPGRDPSDLETRITPKD